MKAIVRNWKALLAIVLVLAAAAVYFLGYRPGAENFARQREQLTQQNAQLQTTIAENERYKDVQDQLSPALDAIEESRASLYDAFPRGMREEDQLLYLLGLGDQFGGGGGELGFSTDLRQVFLEKFNVDITYTFGTPAALLALSDGSLLQGQTVTVYYSGGYGDVKEMIRYLGEEAPSITSIQFADMRWLDGEVTGTFTLLNYVLDSGLLEYQEPAVEAPETGKTNIFE